MNSFAQMDHPFHKEFGAYFTMSCIELVPRKGAQGRHNYFVRFIKPRKMLRSVTAILRQWIVHHYSLKG